MEQVRETICTLGEEDAGVRAAIAKAHRTCKICGKPAVFFNSDRAEIRYKLSLMCQSCQDYCRVE